MYDIVVVGAGIVGMSVAMQFSNRFPFLKIMVIDKENECAKHQTGRNSGVIHSGIYYKPGSLKAKTCTRGVKLLHEFCNKYSIPYETTGKIIIATNEKETQGLENLKKRGEENGLENLKILSRKEVTAREPKVKCVNGLLVPITGIIDYKSVVNAYKYVIQKNNGKVLLNSELKEVKKLENKLELVTSNNKILTKFLINCAGLQSDRVAKICGINPQMSIIPFRGDYYHLTSDVKDYVKGLIYPLPDPQFPFLGVHFTKMISGERECGPNAVLSLKREGYTKTSFSLKDSLQIILYPGSWIMAAKYWKMGALEFYRAFNKTAFLKEVNKMIPAIKKCNLISGQPGVRAQALTLNGKLVDDFIFKEDDNMLHVLNAPSPAATASLAIADQIIEKAVTRFGLIN